MKSAKLSRKRGFLMVPLGAFIFRVRLMRHGVPSGGLGATPEVGEVMEVPRRETPSDR